MTHQVDIKEDTRVVIRLKADGTGVLCPDIGVESKHLVHSDGRAAVKMMLVDDRVVVLPPPRQPANSSSNSSSRTTTNSRAHARQHNHSAAQRSYRNPQPSKEAGRQTRFSGTGTSGSRKAAGNSRQSVTQQQGAQ